MLFVARVGVAFCMLAPAATSQAAHFVHTGRVLDEQRKPVANAQVTLVGAGVCEGIDESDVVRVESDAEGRFRAQLQPAREYVAWAAIPADLGFVVSPAAGVGALPSELVIAAKVTNRLRIERIDAWRALGPLRVEVEPSECPGLTLRGDLGDDGTMALPPVPTTFAALRVFAKDVVVHKTSGKVHEPFGMPPPQRLRVRVVDEHDQPVPGAIVERVLWHWSGRDAPLLPHPVGRRYPIAKTGDDGTAEVLLAGAAEPLGGVAEMFVLHATREGRGDGVAGITSEPFVDDKLVSAAGLNGVLPIRLHAPRTVHVRTRGAAPSIVQLTGGRRIPYQTAVTEITDSVRAPIRDGVVTLEAWSTDCMLEIPWPSLGLAADDPWQRAGRSLPLVLPASAIDENELALGDALPLRLQVLDAAAGPAIGARILCAAATANAFVLPHLALQVIADRSGRAVLPVLPGKWFVMAVLDTTIAYAVIDVAPAIAPQTLQLRPLDYMHVRVVDGAGKPLANVQFTLDHSDHGHAPTTAVGRMLYVAGSQVSAWALRHCLTDANGNADVPFLADGCPDMPLRVHAGGGSTSVNAEANAQRLEIVVK